MLFWCNYSIAKEGCTDLIDITFKFTDITGKEVDIDDKDIFFAKYEFKNKSDKTIEITNLILSTADGKNVLDEDLSTWATKSYLLPYRKLSREIWKVYELNLDVVKQTGYKCRFVDKQKIEIENKTKADIKQKKTGTKSLAEKIFGD